MTGNSVLLTCPYCGGVHQGVCLRVKAIEYAEDGITVTRVEFHAPPMQIGGPPYQISTLEPPFNVTSQTNG